MRTIVNLIRLLRPTQWAKNIIVLAGLVFSMNVGNPRAVSRALLALAIFCMLSGSGYALNDLWDLEQDRRHPTKCRRPLPSGALPPYAAVVVSALALLIGLGLAWWKLGLPFLLLAVAYVVLTSAYTIYLKHVVILDVLAISGCFLLRAAAGAAAIPVYMSSWLFGCTLLLSLFIATGKRRAELQLLKEDAVHHRKVITEYTPKLLDQMIAIVTGATLISYLLYTVWPDTIVRFGTDNLKYTVPFVLYGIFRYLYLIYRHEEGGEPELSLFGDLPLIIDLLLYAAAVLLVIYFR